MKKLIFTFSLLLISCILCGCFSNTRYIPGETSLGDAKRIEKDGFSITLTDIFKEKQSTQGFDAYFVTDFCGVVVLKEDFTLEEGLAEKSLEDYIKGVIENNGHTDVTPQNEDGLWFYERIAKGGYSRSYCYKGSDTFLIVQFICNPDDAANLEYIFEQWAHNVELEKPWIRSLLYS